MLRQAVTQKPNDSEYKRKKKTSKGILVPTQIAQGEKHISCRSKHNYVLSLVL